MFSRVHRSRGLGSSWPPLRCVLGAGLVALARLPLCRAKPVGGQWTFKATSGTESASVAFSARPWHAYGTAAARRDGTMFEWGSEGFVRVRNVLDGEPSAVRETFGTGHPVAFECPTKAPHLRLGIDHRRETGRGVRTAPGKPGPEPGGLPRGKLQRIGSALLLRRRHYGPTCPARSRN